MRKLFTLFFIGCLPLLLIGQAASESLSKVEVLVSKKNYSEALQALQQAEKQIEQLYLAELEEVLLPEIIGNYKVVNSNDGFNSSAVRGNAIILRRMFAKQVENTNDEMESIPSTIQITITNAPDKLCEVIGMMGMGESIEAELSLESYSGYRAVSQFDNVAGFGRLSIIVGAACIEIQGESITNRQDLLAVADKLSLEQVVETFGR